MDLYNKYRPTKFKQIVGNKTTVTALQRMVSTKNMPNAILFTGPYGCGKTTFGKCIKSELNIGESDYFELDTGIFRGIDTVRDLRKKANYPPSFSDYRIWLLDEVHMLGRGGDSSKNEAQQALLKVLEDAPEYVIFILCTTNPEMLNKTIISRCMWFEVEKLTEPQMTLLIKRIAKFEERKLSKKVIKKIVKNGKGHARDSLQILQSVLLQNNEKAMLKAAVNQRSVEEKQTIELCRALINGENWTTTRKILAGLKQADPETIRRQIIGYASAVLLNGNESGSFVLGWFLDKSTYDHGFPLIVQYSYNIIKQIEPPC